jgi:Domain of unknown function (DUF4145)
MTLVAPQLNKPGFTCPYNSCGAFSKQTWLRAFWLYPHSSQYTRIDSLLLVVCDHCGKFSVWIDEKLVFPVVRIAPAPHPDMPESIKADFEEARTVFAGSPRSSAALLRLAIQKICIELGLPGKNLNKDIGKLVKQGLPIQVQQSLDIVRVIGNNQVHPGVLDVRDDESITKTLFDLVNVIVEDRIIRPKTIATLYARLPEGARKQIEERDATKPKSRP